MLNKNVAEVLLAHDGLGTIHEKELKAVAGYLKAHIEDLLTNFGTALESSEAAKIEDDTVIFKGIRCRDGKKSYVTCTAFLPLTIYDFQDPSQADAAVRIKETIDLMSNLDVAGRSRHIIDLHACSDFEHSSAWFYVVEFETQSLKTLWDIGASEQQPDWLQVIQGVLDAVQFAHSCDVVLRSLSPASFLYMEDGTPVFYLIHHIGREQKYSGEYTDYQVFYTTTYIIEQFIQDKDWACCN